MQQQQAMERREVFISNALHSIVGKMEQFKWKNVSQYLRQYEEDMELNKVPTNDMLASFELDVPKVIAHIRKIRRGHGDD